VNPNLDRFVWNRIVRNFIEGDEPMSLDPVLRERIESIIRADRVVLFMKGTPDAPQCGFSAQVVGILGQLLPEYGSFDVLSDREVREAIKEFSSWPTIPQLYVDGEFQGGCDIVKELYASGELRLLRGGEASPTRGLPVSDDAAERCAVIASQEASSHVAIDASFSTRSLGPREGHEIAASSNGLTILFDRDSRLAPTDS
jgi:monothiol glutaredoxin